MKKLIVIALFLNAVLLAGRFWQELPANAAMPATDSRFCADTNGDGKIDLSDAVTVLNHLFTGTATPYCIAQGVSLDDFVTRDELDAELAALQGLLGMSRIKTVEIPSSGSVMDGTRTAGSITIDAPADGFVFVTASGMVQLAGKTDDGYSSIRVAVSETESLEAANATRFYLGASISGNYEIPYAVTRLFPVSRGSNRFFLVAVEDGAVGTGQLFFNRLTALFVKNQG